jgi:hypothetical protein
MSCFYRSKFTLEQTMKELDWVGGQCHAPAVLPPENEPPYSLNRRLGEPQARPGRVQKFSPATGFDPRTAQHVASRSFFTVNFI